MGERSGWMPKQPVAREEYTDIEYLQPHSAEFNKIRQRRQSNFLDALREFSSPTPEERRDPYEDAIRGQRLGDAFVRNHHISIESNADPFYVKRFKEQIINMAPNPEQGRIMLSGCLAQFGAYEAIKEAITLQSVPELESAELYYPLAEEDLHGGTDMFIKMGDTVYAIQLKSFPVPLAHNPVFSAFNPHYPLDDQVDRVLSPILRNLETSDRNRERLENTAYQSTMRSMKNLLKSAEGYTNVIPLLMTMSSPLNKSVSDLDEIGQPKTSDLAEKVAKRLIDIHSMRDRLVAEQG